VHIQLGQQEEDELCLDSGLKSVAAFQFFTHVWLPIRFPGRQALIEAHLHFAAAVVQWQCTFALGSQHPS
jgi:hypothetical protein